VPRTGGASAALLFATALLVPVAGHAQLKADFAPSESQASKRIDIIDIEFSQSRSMFTWCDKNGQLWVGKIDPDTGEVTKPQLHLLDPDAITPADMKYTTNGPEWVSTPTGDHVVYTKFIADPRKPKNARMALVELSADGSTWSEPQLLPSDAGRTAVYTSDDPSDPKPRISYVDGKNNHFWRYLYEPASEVAVKGMAQTAKAVSVRFTKGYNGLVYSQDVAGVKQVFFLTLDNGKLQQITTDDGDKDLRTVPWVWRAPEFNNKLVLMTTVNENELRFYKGDGAGTWAKVSSVKLPEGSTVASPEPFTYNGKSYVSLAVKSAAYSYANAVYLAAVSPNAKTPLWKVTDDTDGHMRMDPEVFVTSANGPMVFFNKFDPSKDPSGENPNCKECAEGLFHAASGL